MTSDLETARDIFRRAVLEAMDEAAREIFGLTGAHLPEGATDADLPELFPVLDAQLTRLASRFGCPLA